MKPIRITMLIAELGLTGTPRVMMDIIENIDHNKFEVSVVYKREYSKANLDLEKDIKDMGIRLIPLKGQRLFNFSGILDLYYHLYRDRIQIIHCWDALGIVARILKFPTGCRVIESYCNPVDSKGSWKYYLANKTTSLFMDGIIFCSRGVEASYIKNQVLFLRKKTTALIANCIDTSTFNTSKVNQEETRKKWGLDNTSVLLTNIGYFNAQKGQEYLLRAMKTIVSKVSNVKLIIAGWGPREIFLKQESKKLDIANSVIFAGKCPRDAIVEILSITDIFVLSSLWEGFGLVIGEAMAMGKPVVCTRTTGSDLLVRQGDTGIIVPPKDARSLADAVISLINKPDLMQEMGERGKRRVARLFSPEKFIREHENFYQKILQE